MGPQLGIWASIPGVRPVHLPLFCKAPNGHSKGIAWKPGPNLIDAITSLQVFSLLLPLAFSLSCGDLPDTQSYFSTYF